VLALIGSMAFLIAVHMPIAFAVGIAAWSTSAARRAALIVVPHRMIAHGSFLLAMPLFVRPGTS